MKQIVLAFDQLLNTTPNILRPIFPSIEQGMADETISARAWRRQHDGKRWMYFRIAIDGLFFWDEDHCQESYINELLRKQLPEEYRDR